MFNCNEISLNSNPIMLIGSACSGIEIIRDLFTLLPGVVGWNNSETEQLWRSGNTKHPTDEISAANASPKIRRTIRKSFRKRAEASNAQFIMDATSANSLRLPFVQAVFPEAKYLFLVRDGRDVVVETLQQWKKIDSFKNRFLRAFSANQHLRSWGPRFSGIDQMLQQSPRVEICAEQWRQSVLQAANAFETSGEENVSILMYEDLNSNPAFHLQELADFIGLTIAPQQIEHLAAIISNPNLTTTLGQWNRMLDPVTAPNLTTYLAETLTEMGYEAKTLRETQQHREPISAKRFAA